MEALEKCINYLAQKNYPYYPNKKDALLFDALKEIRDVINNAEEYNDEVDEHNAKFTQDDETRDKRLDEIEEKITGLFISIKTNFEIIKEVDKRKNRELISGPTVLLNNSSLKLIHTVFSDGIIEIEENWKSPTRRYYKHILDTKEEGFQCGLVGLGWIPPEGRKYLQNQIDSWRECAKQRLSFAVENQKLKEENEQLKIALEGAEEDLHTIINSKDNQ